MIDILQSKVLSRVKSELPQKYKDKFPDLRFTTKTENTITKFPTISIKLMTAPEVGQDLDNVDINGVNATFQVDVYDNSTSETNVKNLMNEVVKIMKSMRFNVADSPFIEDGNPIRNRARFRRIIGASDLL